MKENSKFRTSGFTLVELMVVIVIIAVLATLSVLGYSRMKKKATAASSVSNLRQISIGLAAYSTDNNNSFPSIRGFDSSEGDSPDFRYWHWKLYYQAYSPTQEYVEDTAWPDSFLYNPLLDPAEVTNWTCGYAMNARLIENIYNIGWTKAVAKPLKIAAIKDASRAPIVAPRHDHHYRSANDLLYSDDEIPVAPILFCDGHVESLTKKEYEDRDYYDMLKKK